MAIEYDPSENPTTGIPFSNGQEEAGLINKKSEGGAYTNESVGEYATAVSAANNAKQSELNAAESETNAATSATQAATSATSAESSATTANTAESNATSAATSAGVSETNAAESATASATSASNAATSESNAATSASQASVSATEALASQNAAATSETNAAASESAAATSASNASTSATNAASSATASASSATASADSASSSATSADNAATSETNAATSATNAANSATNASTSETNAATSESNAATSALNAATSETNASTSESNAATSEANAAISETNAANSASASASSATASATSASHAATSESNASTSEDNALASATAAANSASVAAASEANAQASAAAALASEQAAQSSEDDAETAQVAAESAQASAEAAETAAETAQVAAETAQTASESAQTAAESAQASATASANSATASATSAASSAQDAQSSEDDAETSATAAAASASAASSSASAASTSATASATSATQSATSASNAATSASNAATSETNAATSATNAFASETAAATSEDNASNSATASANSATASASSAAAALASETAAATSETNAAASELAAATSESNAATSESNAATSETNAATSETNAATSETNASNSATAALASEIAAATSEANASTSETNAAASESAAATSETNAGISETNASNSATAAANSASAASTSETNAAASELAASISETNAATSETNASTSATAAASSATSASTSASSASDSESAASASELAAATSESNAASSATSAASSATAAAISATSASDSASAAATSETNAETAETNAASSASAAATSETNAANSASAAATSASNASTSETNAEAVKTTLYGIYLGLATADPTVDLNGQALNGGEFYYNTNSNVTRIYNGSSWVNGAVDTSAFVLTNSDATLDSLQLNGGTGTQGTLSWNTDEETVDLVLDGATLQLGQEVHYHVRNNTASAIPNGTAVYATGTLGASGRITIAPFLADGNTPAKYFIGITTEEIAAGADGKVTDFGKVRNLDTTSYNDGDVLYPSSTVAGGLTNVAPTSPALSIPCAFVVYSGNNGNIFVRVHPQDENAYATYSQGALADTAVQPGDNVSDLTNDASYATTSYVDTAESDAVITANAYTDTRETAITTAYESYTDTAISNLVDTAPTTLDTLNELAAALGDDPNFATTVSTDLSTKALKSTTVSAGTALTGGGDLSTNRTISHSNVTRSDTTGTGTLSHSGTFTAITGLTSNAQGHVTGAETTTYTLPAGAVPNNATITIGAGTDLSTGGAFTTDQGVNETITLNHSSVTRSNTTSSSSPAHGGTFTAIDSVTTSSTGHITGVNTKTVTLPADNNTWRPIHDSPVDGATTTSISSNWAFDNVKTAVPSGAVFTDTVYSHPTYTGDDFSVDTGPLTGATVVSDIDINVTTDTLGHVTDANGVVSTRTLTLGDLGYTGATDANKYVHPTYAGDDINLDTGALSGATVISDLDFNVTTDTLGHVTDANATYSTRNLTYSDVGAAAASHNHDGRYAYSDYINSGYDWNTFSYGSNEGVIARVESSAANPPITGVYNWSLYQQGDSNRGSQIAVSAYAGGNKMFYRTSNLQNGWNSWSRMYDDIYHPNADKWTTARTLSLTGDVTGSVSMDGSGNVSMTTTVANDSHTHDGRYTRVHSGSFTVGGDANTYYPVYFAGGSQQLMTEVEIYRAYSETAPSTWYTSTHKGGLNFKFRANWGGWGGASYDLHIEDFRETYSTMVADMGWFGNSRGFYVLLRGGGARYHFRASGGSAGTPTVYDAGTSVDPYGNGSGISARTSVNTSGYLYSRNYTRNSVVYSRNEETAHLGGDQTKSGIFQSNTSLRAPIFYDSNDTAFYTDPAGQSRFNELQVRGGTRGRVVIGNSSWLDTYDTNRPNLTLAGGQYPHLTLDSRVNAANSNHGGVLSFVSALSSGYRRWSMGTGSLNNEVFTLGVYDNSSNPHYGTGGNTLGTTTWGGRYWFDRSGNYQAHGSVRAPIFYDSNNTGYYVDPASTSVLNVASFAGKVDFQGDAAIEGGSGYGIFKGYTNNNNHLMTSRGVISGSTSSPTITGGHNQTFVEYVNDDNSGWFFKDSSTGTYVEKISFRKTYNIFQEDVRAPLFYDSNNTGYYLNPAEKSVLNDMYLLGGIASDNPDSAYHAAALEVRENNFSGSQTDTWAYAPRIGLHWGGRVASQIGLASNARVHILNNPGNGNESLQCQDLFVQGTLYEASDARLKENVVTLEDSLEKVLNLRGVSYNKIGEDLQEVGLIAQEVEDVVPELVTTDEDTMSDSEEPIKKVSYARTVALLIEAIKEQQVQIDELKNELNTLKG